jgi:hypothetical protein
MNEKKEHFTANLTLCSHVNIRVIKMNITCVPFLLSPVMQYEFDDIRYTLLKVTQLKL